MASNFSFYIQSFCIHDAINKPTGFAYRVEQTHNNTHHRFFSVITPESETKQKSCLLGLKHAIEFMLTVQEKNKHKNEDLANHITLNFYTYEYNFFKVIKKISVCVNEKVNLFFKNKNQADVDEIYSLFEGDRRLNNKHKDITIEIAKLMFKLAIGTNRGLLVEAHIAKAKTDAAKKCKEAEYEISDKLFQEVIKVEDYSGKGAGSARQKAIEKYNEQYSETVIKFKQKG